MGLVHEDLIKEWEQTYKPQKNTISGHRGWEGLLFETHGDDWEYVATQPEENVWSYIDDEDGTAFATGRWSENAMGYFICEVPWTEIDFFIVESAYDI